MARVELDPGRRVPILDAASLERLGRSLQGALEAGAGAVVITGGSEGTFGAGADMADLARLTPIEALDFSRAGQDLFDRVESFPGVVIAAIGGRCIGGAFDLVMSCDMRLASTGAVFSHPGPRLGFITGWGGTSRLASLAGPAARGVLLGIRDLDAMEALDVGLVWAVTGPEELEDEALALAGRIAGTAVGRLRLIKEALRRLPGAVSPRLLERRMAGLAAAASGPATRG